VVCSVDEDGAELAVLTHDGLHAVSGSDRRSCRTIVFILTY
jgi:hypothetical protein